MEMLLCLSLSFLSRLNIWTHWFGHFEAAECLESSLAGVEAVRSLSVWQAGGMMPENQSLVLLMWCDSLLGHLVEGYSCTATNQWPCTILINIRGSQRPLLQGLRSSCPPDYSSLWFNTNMDTCSFWVWGARNVNKFPLQIKTTTKIWKRGSNPLIVSLLA